jgi:hypothetical protein
MSGINSGHHHLPTSNFDDIGQCWIFTPHFHAVFWQPFWKWQTACKFWQRRIAPIGFYSNPHPLWIPKNMALTPFTTNLKTLGSTRNIYL